MSQAFKTSGQRKAEQRAEVLRKREEEKQKKMEEKKRKRAFVGYCILAVIGNALLAGAVFGVLYFIQNP